MKGIYCIKKGNKTLAIKTTNDLDKSLQDFENGTLIEGRVGEYISRSKNISFEVLKETDCPERDIWDYLLPQISRIVYSDNLIEALSEGSIKTKNIVKAVDWFCDIFNENNYTAQLDYERDKQVIVRILKDEKLNEIYVFGGGKNPRERIFIS